MAPLYGGYPIAAAGQGCSIGFNTWVPNVPSPGSLFPSLLTAGHCVKNAGTAHVTSQGVAVGPMRSASYPGNDDGSVWNFNPSNAVAGPVVTAWEANPGGINGTPITIKGQTTATDNPSGATLLCKSGITTHWTCGKVDKVNVTVNYPNEPGLPGGPVTGLVRHTACTKPGDSGGAVVTPIGQNWYALGINSGGSLYGGLCGSELQPSQPNVSYYQPIGPALARHGLLLMTG